MVMNVIVPEVPGLQEFITQLDRYDEDLTKVLLKHMRTVATAGKKSVKSFMRSWSGPVHKPAQSFVKSKVVNDINRFGPGAVFGEVYGNFWVRMEVGGRKAGGRKGGMPDARDLVQWVQDKLGVPEDKAKAVAYAVARKIQRTGTKGSDAMGRGKNATQGIADSEFTAALDEMVALLKGNG